MPKRKKPHFRFKKRKPALKGSLEHLKEMKSRPCPGPSLHGRSYEVGSVSELLDAELLEGACSPSSILRSLWSSSRAAEMSEAELDAIDEALQGPQEAPALTG